MRVPTLLLTEEAVRLLNATHADFAQLPPARSAGRIAGGASTSFVPYDFQQVRAQSEYLRLVSIVEAYVDACCRRTLELRIINNDDVVKRLAESALASANISWDERKRAFAQYHSVQLGTCLRYSEVEAAIQVRNAIAHGLGSLTSRQGNKDARKMEAVGVKFRGASLWIDSAALATCHRASVSFVKDLDRRIQPR